MVGDKVKEDVVVLGADEEKPKIPWTNPPVKSIFSQPRMKEALQNLRYDLNAPRDLLL